MVIGAISEGYSFKSFQSGHCAPTLRYYLNRGTLDIVKKSDQGANVEKNIVKDEDVEPVLDGEEQYCVHDCSQSESQV